ncbi:MAG: ABC transporter permease, partial [Gemmobacter sp.]
MIRRLAGWSLSTPATALVALFLILPVAATIAATFGGTSPFALYEAFLASGFRRAVLWRTLEIAAIT